MPLNINFQQILLHLFNFVVLFAILYFLLYKPVKQFMDKRTDYYRTLDEEAKANVEKTAQAKEEYENKLAAVEDEISEKRKTAYAELEQAAASREKRAEEEAQKIIEDARKNIENEHARMLKEAEAEITDMVAAAAEKIVSKSTTSEAFDDFLDAATKGAMKNE